MMMLIDFLEKNGLGAILTCCDVRKCFDSVYLSDMNWFLMKNKADPKAVRLFQKLAGSNNLRIQGDEKTFPISNGEGQGGKC